MVRKRQLTPIKSFVFCFVLHLFFENWIKSYGKMCIIITDPKQTSTTKISIDGENMLASELSNGKKLTFRLFKQSTEYIFD